jgi:hypothetical protein
VQILAEAAKLVYIATQKIQKHFAEAFVEIGTLTSEFTHKVCTHNSVDGRTGHAQLQTGSGAEQPRPLIDLLLFLGRVVAVDRTKSQRHGVPNALWCSSCAALGFVHEPQGAAG